MEGYKGNCKVLIEKGAEIPVEGRSSHLILVFACQHGLDELFKKQVEKGIKISSSDYQTGSLLHDAAKADHQK